MTSMCDLVHSPY